jgi:hypothetical protein
MTADDDRIAALEAENASLRSELERLRPPPPPPPTIGGPFCFPTPREMTRLIAAVLIKYPMLRDPRIDDAELLEMTTAAFRFLSGLPRTPGRLDLRHDLLSWNGYAGDAFSSGRQILHAARTRPAHRGDRLRRCSVSPTTFVSECWFRRLPDRCHERYPPADECLVASFGSSV